VRKYWLVALFAGFISIYIAPPVHADSVRISPLQYQTELKKGEKKKGFVDVSNPSNESVNVKLYVNGFSQTDNQGNLTFFTSEQMSKGLLLDYDSASIGAHQTLRLYFLADGTKLPAGDLFGVIFAETQSADQPGTNITARVGTLVEIINQTPGARHAEIAQLDIPFVQFGDDVGGVISVKNPAPKSSATGFFPNIAIEVALGGSKTEFKGPLVFAGNTRTAGFTVPSNQFGFYVVKVKAADAEASKVVFLMTGWWRIVVPAIIIVVIGAVFLFKKYRSRKKKTVWSRIRHFVKNIRK
jgi:hypothetical protein